MTIAFGAMLFFTLPSSPDTAYFLTADEKELASRQLLNNGSKKIAKYKKEQVLEALTDVQAWLLTLNAFCVNIATGGLAAVSGAIYETFYSNLIKNTVW